LIARGDAPGALAVLAPIDAATIDPSNVVFVLTVRAQALLAMGRTDDALAAVRAAATVLDRLGQLEEGESYVRLVHVEVLRAAAQDVQPALGHAAKRIAACASRIVQPEWRERFLAGVPENVRTLALARELA
jgi:hypothetical protein